MVFKFVNRYRESTIKAFIVTCGPRFVANTHGIFEMEDGSILENRIVRELYQDLPHSHLLPLLYATATSRC
jgi:hypothetical protein